MEWKLWIWIIVCGLHLFKTEDDELHVSNALFFILRDLKSRVEKIKIYINYWYMTFMKKVFILLTFNNQNYFVFFNKRSTPRFFLFKKVKRR